MKINLKDAAYHRNGISGEGFNVALFKHNKRLMVAVLFEEKGKCAVLDVGLLAEENIRFGENSWRGDDFEDDLRPLLDPFSTAKYAAAEKE